MRGLRMMTTALALVLGGAGCAHSGDPLPPRAKRAGPPESVKDHPGFDGSNATAVDADVAEPQRPLCTLQCPAGQHCETVQGVDRCAPDA
ncbi:MAG: hypothetical protein WBV82_04755 [Myxococcaceae bacterium]